MAQSSVPLLVEVAPDRNLNDLLAERVGRAPDAPFLERLDPGTATWRPTSARAFDADVVATAKGLVAHGVQPGDRVALLSRTRWEWSVLDWAIWAVGAVSVPVYETSSVEQLAWIASDAEVGLIVVENDGHAGTVAQVRDRCPTLREVLVIDGRDVPDGEVARRRGLAVLDDVATIIYTSGTTGRPKGVLLTHGNFYLLAVNVRRRIAVVFDSEPTGARTLLFMPLAHVFARFVNVLVVPADVVVGFVPDTRTLMADMSSFRPTFLLSVPRVFEKVYSAAEQKATAGGKSAIFQRAAKTAIVYSRALDEPGGPSLWLRLQHKVADVLVLSKIRTALGGRLRWAVSGGAPLGERLGHFFRGVGLVVLEGYGLTETTAPVAVSVPERVKIGTVGPPLPGTSLRIAPDGEIEAKGIPVFAGYHANPEATAQAMVDGWFRTGDLGSIDEDGYLRITGRKKEIIVTAAGKNVVPSTLEDRLRGHPLVSQVVVVGDQRPFVGALVTLDADGLPGWLAAHGKPAMSVAQARTDPDVVASLDRAVAYTNQAVSRAESIRKYRVLDRDLTIADGYLTPKLSVRRSEVLKDFSAEIEALYVDDRD